MRVLLVNETDRDVKSAVDEAVDALDRVTVSMESVRYLLKYFHAALTYDLRS